MTRDQLHIAFKIEMDKNSNNIAFGSYPAFLPEEIDYWLNQGMYQEVSNKFTGLNTLKQPFEKSVKRIHDLEKLIRTKKNISMYCDDALNKCTAENIFNDAMFFVDAYFKFGAKQSDVILVEHDNVGQFKRTYNNLPYIQTPVAVIENSDLIIYFDPITMNASSYLVDLTYVKNPTKVEELGEEGMVEFPEYMQQEIVNRAVQLALENIESKRVETKSQFNQMDE